MDCISSQQAAKLFVDALRVASRLDPTQPVLVVIDGLDETDRKHLNNTAVIFSGLFKELTRYPNVKVLISSRTKDDIRYPFTLNQEVEYIEHVHLDIADSRLGGVWSFPRKIVVHIVEHCGSVNFPTREFPLLSYSTCGFIFFLGFLLRSVLGSVLVKNSCDATASNIQAHNTVH